MAYKNFSNLDAVSKDATFSTTAVDISRDVLLSLVVTTTAQSSLNVSIQLQVSNDGTNWIDSGSPTAVTTNTSTAFTLSDTPYAYARLTTTFTAGSATFQVQGQTKGWG